MTEEPLDEMNLIKDQETIDRVSNKIFPVLQTKEEMTIINEFDKKEYSDIDLTLCIDTVHNNNTILTTLVNYNLTRAVNYFISLIKSYNKSVSDHLAYINQKNSKGYNALLYSAFRGNLQIFIKLMDNGADINSTTSSSGLNVLHLASQGNYPNIIVYLIEKYKMDINFQDNKGNSGLHWAMYMNNKQAVKYLVYYKIDQSLRDNDNDTALDIAIRRGNNYLVKKFKEDYSLLNKNSIINIKDVKIKQSSNSNDISNKKENSLIKIMWDKFSKSKYLRTSSYMYPFLIYIILLELFNQIIIIRGYKNYFMSMVFMIQFMMLLFFYLTANKSDAGEIFSKCINNLVLLAEQGEDMKNICPWCINYTSENSHHCFLCKRCFDNQQFHENLINNCVGKNNFSLFLSFLFFFTINFCFKLLICLWGLFWLKGDNFKRSIGFIIPAILGLLGGMALGVSKIRKNLNLSYEMNFGNLFIKDVKESNNTETNITISNSIDKNNNIQLTTLG